MTAYELFTAEALAMHEHLDALGAPREHEGEKLTPSQRLAIIRRDVAGMYAHVQQLRLAVLCNRTGGTA